MSTAVNPPADQGGSSGSDRDRTSIRAERKDIVAREKDHFGGMKFGSAFFGWLTATGTAVLLSGLLAAIAAAIGLNVPTTTPESARTVGIVGGIVVLAVALVAYFCGGYVAGRMARFDGVKQGLGVWLWAIIAAVVVAILSAIAGSQFDVFSYLNGLPQIPVGGQTATTGGIIVAIAVAIVALVGAVLGGLTGMRYHRRVDKAGLDR